MGGNFPDACSFDRITVKGKKLQKKDEERKINKFS